MEIHHIGYLVDNIEEAQKNFLILGYSKSSKVYFDDYRRVKIIFLNNNIYNVELIEPFQENSIVKNLIKRYKNSPYHICYITKNLNDEVISLRKQGFIPLGSPAPAIALQNKNVIFLFNKNIGIIELIEEK